jgi:hypothetical protein
MVAVARLWARLRDWLRASGPLALVGLAAGAYLWIGYPSIRLTRIETLLPFVLIAAIVYELVSPRMALNKSRLIVYALFALSIILNFSIVFEKWFYGVGDVFSFSGLLAHSDSQGYLQGARRLIEFGRLDDWAARRPLGVIYFGVLQFVTGQNLQATILLSTLLVASSMYVCARTLYDAFGISAALLMLCLLTYWNAPFVNAILTEQPGLLFGNLAFVLLFKGFLHHRFRLVCAGLLLLSLAMSIRAGAFFVLPLLALLAGFVFRTGKQKLNFRTVVVCLLVLASVAVVNSGLLRLAGPKDGQVPMGNFSYALYGLVKGNQGWTYVYQEHPELNDPSLSDAQRSRMVYGWVRTEVAEHPSALLVTVCKVGLHNVRNVFNLLFPFAFFWPQAIFALPFFYVILIGFRRRLAPCGNLPLLFLTALVGILLSSPFLVDGGYRVYAATAALPCAMAAVGMKLILQRLNPGRFVAPGPAQSAMEVRSVVAFAAALILLIVLLPVYWRIWPASKALPASAGACEAQTVMIRIAPGSLLAIAADSTPTLIPRVRWEDFQRRNPGYHVEDQALKSVRPGEYLLSGVVNLADASRHLPYVILEGQGIRCGIASCCLQLQPGSGGLVYRGRIIDYVKFDK